MRIPATKTPRHQDTRIQLILAAKTREETRSTSSPLTTHHSPFTFFLTLLTLLTLLNYSTILSKPRAAIKAGLNFSGFGLKGDQRIFTLDIEDLNWKHLGYSGGFSLGFDLFSNLNMEFEVSLGNLKYARLYNNGKFKFGQIDLLKFPVSIGYRFNSGLEIFGGGYYAFRLDYSPGIRRQEENTEKIEKTNTGIIAGIRMRQFPILLEIRGNYTLKFINEYRLLHVEIMLGIILDKWMK